MTDGRFNRPATAESFQQAGLNEAVGDIFELSGHEFEARYRHVQQLVRARTPAPVGHRWIRLSLPPAPSHAQEYIRRCRLRPRGPLSQMRLLISPFGTQDCDHYPSESKRGLPIRKGVNRSLDKLRPLSPHMETDFGIMPNSMAQARSEGCQESWTAVPLRFSRLGRFVASLDIDTSSRRLRCRSRARSAAPSPYLRSRRTVTCPSRPVRCRRTAAQSCLQCPPSRRSRQPRRRGASRAPSSPAESTKRARRRPCRASWARLIGIPVPRSVSSAAVSARVMGFVMPVCRATAFAHTVFRRAGLLDQLGGDERGATRR